MRGWEGLPWYKRLVLLTPRIQVASWHDLPAPEGNVVDALLWDTGAMRAFSGSQTLRKCFQQFKFAPIVFHHGCETCF